MTPTPAPRTWLITGASRGLGQALAEAVLKSGDQVVLAARSQEVMEGLASEYPGAALTQHLDVTNPAERRAAVQTAIARFGKIDVLVNNAAIDFVGALEEQREQDYRATFEVNVFAAIEMARLVLPGMRSRGSGVIVNISSMDGISALAANGYYSASKFAIEGLTDALAQEIEPLGLQAISILPGSFRTGIEQRTQASGEAIKDYAATSGAFRALVQEASPEQFPGDPARAASAIIEVVRSGLPRRRVVLGSDAQRRIGVKLEELRSELEAGQAMALSTDFPGSGPAIL